MKRMKTFFIYALLVAIVIISSDFIINLCLDTNYRELENYKIEANVPSISVKQAKTTNVNGYIEGTITNNSESNIEKVYVKLDLLSEQGNNIGTEYYEVTGLKQNESKDFKIDYKQDNVEGFIISTAEEVENKNIKLMPIIKHVERYFLAGILISIVPFYFF